MARIMDIFSEQILRVAFSKADPTCTVCKKAPAIAYSTVRIGNMFGAGHGHCADCYAEKLNKGDKGVCAKG